MSENKKTILVTGGSRGIGAAIVRLLGDEYQVLYTSTAKNNDDKHHYLDFRDEGSIDALRNHLMEGGVKLYGLVNNAAICETAEITQKPDQFKAMWDNVLSVNLTGQALLTNALMPLIERLGRIVNISSQLGKIGREGYSAYCASKFGLIGLTEVWSRELAKDGVTVNAVCPGWIQTEMTDDDLKRMAEEAGRDFESFRDELYSELDLKRFNTPDEVAEIVRFLLSPKGSGVTGRSIEMAGPSA